MEENAFVGGASLLGLVTQKRTLSVAARSLNINMRKRIVIEHLRVGMRLDEFIGSWLERPF